jgi:hypothetical protein
MGLSLSLTVYVHSLVVCRSCECCGCTHAVVVVLPGSMETTPFDDAVAHSINQSGAPSSASASSVMHPPPPQLLERRLESGDTADSRRPSVCARKDVEWPPPPSHHQIEQQTHSRIEADFSYTNDDDAGPFVSCHCDWLLRDCLCCCGRKGKKAATVQLWRVL